MIERLTNDVLQDEYFIALNNKAAKLLANNLFLENEMSRLGLCKQSVLSIIYQILIN